MNDRFLKACRRQETDTTPIWIMRQAGRYLPDYRAVRSKVSFLELCKTPELAAEVTVQPVDQIGVDAAIIFSDILLPAEAMGLKLELDDKGPRFPEPVRSAADVERLAVPDPEDRLAFVGKAIALTKKQLAGRVPLIGFAGAPFTLASYVVEGKTSKHFLLVKRMLFESPELAHKLLDKITRTIIASLRAQVAAGAQVVQIFDSWGGELSPVDFDAFSFPYLSRIVSELKTTGVPVIVFGTGMGGVLERLARTGADVVGVDWRLDLDVARARLGKGVAVQGNMDPLALFLPEKALSQRVELILKQAGSAPGHIFNLGHGIVPETDPAKAKLLVDEVHRLGREMRKRAKP